MRRFILVILAVLATPVAQALPITVTSSGGTLTDTITGLEWYRPNLTTNCSYNDVVSNSCGGTLYADGWRHATRAQVFDFLSRWSIVVPTAPDYTAINYTGSHQPGLAALMSDLGYTSNTAFNTHVQGMTADAVLGSPGSHYRVNMFTTTLPASSLAGDNTWSISTPHVSIGHWLIMGDSSSVPEPGLFPMLSLGLLGMFLMRRRVFQGNTGTDCRQS